MPPSPTAFDPAKFIEAQADVFEAVARELAQGRKQTHWMWFVFPQHKALGHSEMAKKYGLSSAHEARAYSAHPVLGPRLRQLCDLLLLIERKTASEILGSPDDLKLRSCMTLFAQAMPEEDIFERVLARFWSGEQDARTVELLREG